MERYKPEWMSPISISLRSSDSGSVNLHSVPPPASGAILSAILNIVDTYQDAMDDPLFYHRIVESFKWAYAARSNLGDPFDDEITDFIG